MATRRVYTFRATFLGTCHLYHNAYLVLFVTTNATSCPFLHEFTFLAIISIDYYITRTSSFSFVVPRPSSSIVDFSGFHVHFLQLLAIFLISFKIMYHPKYKWAYRISVWIYVHIWF
jgi:hypothetical protein